VAVVSMSKQEFGRLEVLLRVQSGGLCVADACELIGLHRRQVFRLLRGLSQDGATSLLSKHRGKPSNHRLPAEVRTLTLSIVRDRYADFDPTLAAEKLAEHHGCSVSPRITWRKGGSERRTPDNSASAGSLRAS
jgi:winged helix-turn helix protein